MTNCKIIASTLEITAFCQTILWPRHLYLQEAPEVDLPEVDLPNVDLRTLDYTGMDKPKVRRHYSYTLTSCNGFNDRKPIYQVLVNFMALTN